MANIFGSRMASPQGAGAVWEATADLAQTAFDVNLGIMEAVDSAEAEGQLRSLDVGMIERYDEFSAWMDDNGHNPDAFLTEFDTRAKQWKTDLMAGVTQKRAQQTASGNIDGNIARWRAAVRKKQYQTKAHNVGVDAEINAKKLTEAPDRTWDDADVAERLKAFGLLTQQMWDGQQFDTETQRDAYLQDGRKKILSNYALQQADSPEYFDSVNQVYRETGVLGAEIFNEDEIADLKKRYLAEKDFNEKLAMVADERAVETATTDALKLAAAGDLEGAKKLAVDMLGKYPHEKFVDTLNNIQNAASILQKTGQNPYETTQDWGAAMDAYWKAEEGIAPDRKDVGPKYDVQWYEKLKKIAEGGSTAADFEDSKAAKFLSDNLVNDKETIPDNVFTVIREKGYRLLWDAIQSAEKPLTDREKKDKALEIYNNLKAEVAAGKFKKLTPESMKTPAEIAAKEEAENKARMQYQPTRDEFRKRVAQLKAQGQERAARKYYDQWKKILWPD